MSVLIRHPREIQALWSQNYDTEILHRNTVKEVDIAMPCHRSGYDRHKIRTPATQIHYIPLKQGVLKTLFAKPAGTPVIWIKPLLEMSVLESKNSSDRYKYVRDTKATRYPGGLFGLVFQPPRPAPPSDYRTYNTQDKHLRRISQQ